MSIFIQNVRNFLSPLIVVLGLFVLSPTVAEASVIYGVTGSTYTNDCDTTSGGGVLRDICYNDSSFNGLIVVYRNGSNTESMSVNTTSGTDYGLADYSNFSTSGNTLVDDTYKVYKVIGCTPLTDCPVEAEFTLISGNFYNTNNPFELIAVPPSVIPALQGNTPNFSIQYENYPVVLFDKLYSISMSNNEIILAVISRTQR